MENIILIGMPGCGKSTVGKGLAERLGRQFVDADEELVKRLGPIPDYFAAHGEQAFRREEAKILAELGAKSALVLATGGGCVTVRENYESLHRNGTIVWLRRDLDQLPIDGRPVSQSVALEELYRVREPRYRRFADCIVDNCGSVEDAVKHIMEALYETAHS